jgi:hypothetical protein
MAGFRLLAVLASLTIVLGLWGGSYEYIGGLYQG